MELGQLLGKAAVDRPLHDDVGKLVGRPTHISPRRGFWTHPPYRVPYSTYKIGLHGVIDQNCYSAKQNAKRLHGSPCLRSPCDEQSTSMIGASNTDHAKK